MSSITKCLNTSTICRKVARCDKKLCVVLIEADIFNKAVQGNIPKPLRKLYTKFDVTTLRHCGEMACAEELCILLETLISLSSVQIHARMNVTVWRAVDT